MKALLISLIALTMAGCATRVETVTVTKTIDTACNWVTELSFSKNDTPETKRQIIEHDKAVRKNCPK